MAKARGHLIGETVVTASMNRAVHNFGTAIIRVAPALSLDIIDDHVREVEVGKKVKKNMKTLSLIWQGPYINVLTHNFMTTFVSNNTINISNIFYTFQNKVHSKKIVKFT